MTETLDSTDMYNGLEMKGLGAGSQDSSRVLKTAVNSRNRGFNALFWPPWEHTNKNYIFIYLQGRIWYIFLKGAEYGWYTSLISALRRQSDNFKASLWATTGLLGNWTYDLWGASNALNLWVISLAGKAALKAFYLCQSEAHGSLQAHPVEYRHFLQCRLTVSH